MTSNQTKQEAAHAAAPPGLILGYSINLDERGDFYADVRQEDGQTIFEIHGADLIEDGFMRNKHDLDGLLSHLVELGVAQPSARLMSLAEQEAYLEEDAAEAAEADPVRERQRA